MRRATRTTTPDRLATEAPITATAEGSLAGYRLLRRIANGERADVYLATVDRPDPADADVAALVAVRVYASSAPGESIATEIEAMTADTSGALPELYDVATLDDGRCCLAVERLPGPTLAGLIIRRTLDPGEAVTILAPVVVAVAELAECGFVHTRLSARDVILDATGRPRVIGLGALRRIPAQAQQGERTDLVRSGHEVLADLIEEVMRATRPSGVFDGALEIIRSGLATRPFVACERQVERALFDAATPTPITGAAVRPRSTALPGRMTTPVLETDPTPVGDETRRRRRGALSALAQIAQLPLPVPSAERIADAADRDPAATFVGRLGRRMASRRRVLVVGGLLGGAALVLMLTLVPPASTGHGSAAEADPTPELTDPVASRAADPPARTPQTGSGSTPQSDATEPDLDVVNATAQLLELRASCFATLDQACLAQVAQPDSAIERADLDLLAQARSGVAVPVDEFALDSVMVTAEMGSAVLLAVPYVDAQREPASLLVMRGEAGWRLRELFD